MEAGRGGDSLALRVLGSPLYEGAEAILYPVDWFGAPALAKHRIAKRYRHPLLDARLRVERTITEAKAVAAALKAGVPAPAIYFVDPLEAIIVMEWLRGAEKLADIIEREPDRAMSYVEKLGAHVARLHGARVAHGDLTTSNVLVYQRDVFLIDFGLASLHANLRDRAVDLHLFLRSLEAEHPESVEQALEAFLRGYSFILGRSEAKRLLNLVHEIRLMGRYREERRTAWGQG